jgi:hypothetical protein
MPKRFENPVTLPSAVFEGLEAVQGLRQANMADHQAVQDIAARGGYSETATWIAEHRHEYSKGVFLGFIAEEEG